MPSVRPPSRRAERIGRLRARQMLVLLRYSAYVSLRDHIQRSTIPRTSGADHPLHRWVRRVRYAAMLKRGGWSNAATRRIQGPRGGD
jgi:hypothetical protein